MLHLVKAMELLQCETDVMKALGGWKPSILNMALDKNRFSCQWGCVYLQQDWVYCSTLSFHHHSLSCLIPYLPLEKELYEYPLCSHLFLYGIAHIQMPSVCYDDLIIIMIHNANTTLSKLYIHQKNPVCCYVGNMELFIAHGSVG